jgi:hypothetical protein
MTVARTASRRRGGSLWIGAFIIGALACAAAFVANVVLGEVASSNVWGLSYGIAAAVLLVGCAAYGLRRRSVRVSSRLRLGSARGWLYFHTYAGLIFLLLVLMHSGFELPSGWVTWALWLLSLWLAVSGVLGLGLQRWIPRRLTSGLSIEVHYDRIPELVDETRNRAEKVIAGCGESVRGFYDRSIRPTMAAPRRRWLYFLDITGGRGRRLRELRYLEERLSGEDRARLEELERLYTSKLDMDAHYTLQYALRVWLWAHVPPSIVLLALVAVHLFSVLYY